MIHIFGDTMLDKYVECEISRISQEAPIPVLHPINTDYRLGGAANVAVNVQVFGVPVKLYGIIGICKDGELITNKCKELSIPNEFVVSKNEKTVVKTRILSSGQQIVRLDKEKFFDVQNAHALFEKLKAKYL